TWGARAAGTYFYVVTAIMAAPFGETLASPEAFATTRNGKIDLSWSPVPFATGYRVYREATAAGESVFYSASGTSFTDSGAAPSGAGAPPTTTLATTTATIA